MKPLICLLLLTLPQALAPAISGEESGAIRVWTENGLECWVPVGLPIAHAKCKVPRSYGAAKYLPGGEHE